MTGIARHKNLLGIEIAEFNPERDINDATLDLVNELILSFFKGIQL